MFSWQLLKLCLRRLEWKPLHVFCLFFNPKDPGNYGDALHQARRAKFSPREPCLGVGWFSSCFQSQQEDKGGRELGTEIRKALLHNEADKHFCGERLALRCLFWLSVALGNEVVFLDNTV